MALAASAGGTPGIDVAQILFWAALGLSVLGLAMTGRCIVRGHEVRDLRSLWLGLALLGLSVPLWFGSRMGAAPTDTEANPGRAPPPVVQTVIEKHCYACHSSHPTLTRPPWIQKLDQPGEVNRLSASIYRQVVQLRAMPMGNATQMTDAERQVIARWYEARHRADIEASQPH